MFGFPILEVAIGLCFIYLLLSLICTTVNEAIASATQRRGKMLETAITTLVGDAGIKNKIYSHPLISGMSQDSKSLPSYVPASKFALALMDVLTGKDVPANNSQALRTGIANSTQHLQEALTTVLADSSSHLVTDQQKIEAWYDDAMDRVSGWYKRQTSHWVWGIAVVVTLVLNANTIFVARTLWSNQAVRSAVVDAAKSRAQSGQSGESVPLVEYSNPQDPTASTPVRTSEELTDNERKILGTLLPNWKDDLKDFCDSKASGEVAWVVGHLLGWILTIIALSLGAPFWFDLLNKFMNIRNAGRASDEPRDKSNPTKVAANGATA